MMRRASAIARVAQALDPRWLAVACNGMISRELYAARDAGVHFYMIGSMGLAASIGLGVALAQPDRVVVVLDGDGNVLMNAGALGSVGALGPGNLHHIVFDNGSHASTGGQRTISDRVRIDALARAAGYRSTARVATDDALDAELLRAFGTAGPTMIVVDVAPGNEPVIGRVDIPPPDVATRFRAACLT